MVKLLDALTTPNVGVDSALIPPGQNTESNTRVTVSDWQPWADFNYDTLTRIFQRELSQEYRGEREPRPLYNDLRIHNEESFEDLLRRFVTPVVNYALEGQAISCHYGRGTRCPNRDSYKPDWSLVSEHHINGEGGYRNLLPGDTKLDAKWQPDMIDTRDYGEWQKVVSQVATYMACYFSRYGFIITDTVLVVLRITRQEVGPGLAASRSRRPRGPNPAASHARHPSDVSMTSDGSTFIDNDALNWDYHDPEYAIVPWAAHGRGRLTIKLALWCLAKMASTGDNTIDYCYPDLDSWRIAADSAGYVHNTSGARKARLSERDRHAEPNHGEEPSAWAGEQQGDDGGQPSAAAAAWEAGEAGLRLGLGLGLGPEYHSSLAGPSTATGYDDAHFSQVSSPLAEGAVEFEGYAGGRAEDVGGGDGGDGPREYNADDYDDGDGGNDEDEDDDDQTVVGPTVKRLVVTIQKSRLGKKLYFVDAKGNDRTTSREKRRKVEGGYELGGRKHVYFTKKFP
ncbi:hypothetical protein F5144DRAFT_283697 [Chaetomium tenue]|uniref:Uncharacterized protein n=1 Tax=Chaetomium tenue TaxID=1854479 RepID=A0ACB7P4F4_9PEZI|nr:hypothetical protein F5144DRAFT_283697 [Chaetomium globosum]